MNQKTKGLIRAAAAIISAAALLAASCMSASASVSANTRESADFYPGNTGLTIPGFDDYQNQYDSGIAGVATTSYNYPDTVAGPPPPPSGSVGVDGVTADKGYSAYAYANEPLGILRAYASTWLNVAGARMTSIDINSHVTADAEISDTITLSAPATLILKGSIDGSLGGSSNHGNYDVFEQYIWTPMSVDSWVNFSYYVPGQEARVTQGWSNYWDSRGPVSDSWEVSIALPANTPIRFSAGLDITANVDPDTAGIMGVSWKTPVDPFSLIGGSIWADFSNTMGFQIQAPAGVTVTSQSGYLPIQTVPEPSALAALCSGLGLLGACMRRKRR